MNSLIAKLALLKEWPVVHQGITYKCVSAIIYRKNKNKRVKKKIQWSLELTDKTAAHSVTIVSPERVHLPDGYDICESTKDNNFIKINRLIFQEPYCSQLSYHAKWLYIVLKDLEFRLCEFDSNKFTRTDKELMGDTGLSEKTLKKCKNELKQTLKDSLKISVKNQKTVYEFTDSNFP